MKFSEMSNEAWERDGKYYDTCLIPYTGLTGKETPMEATAALERLRDFMEPLETAFAGRMVTYPACHYAQQDGLRILNEICRNVKSGTFRYAVVITSDCSLAAQDIPESDLVLARTHIGASDPQALRRILSDEIQRLWTR
ncbi:DUF2487 family protein [Paenibacillus sp. CN-4]|uniref:DUF2487 family protein n=1 Tax=Paenibacillus nanchangensis TaxID=3348343 RepID=UPI00397E06EF